MVFTKIFFQFSLVVNPEKIIVLNHFSTYEKKMIMSSNLWYDNKLSKKIEKGNIK